MMKVAVCFVMMVRVRIGIVIAMTM